MSGISKLKGFLPITGGVLTGDLAVEGSVSIESGMLVLDSIASPIPEVVAGLYFLPDPEGRIMYGSGSGWRTVASLNDIASLSNVYLPLSGGEMSGEIDTPYNIGISFLAGGGFKGSTAIRAIDPVELSSVIEFPAADGVVALVSDKGLLSVASSDPLEIPLTVNGSSGQSAALVHYDVDSINKSSITYAGGLHFGPESYFNDQWGFYDELYLSAIGDLAGVNGFNYLEDVALMLDSEHGDWDNSGYIDTWLNGATFGYSTDVTHTQIPATQSDWYSYSYFELAPCDINTIRNNPTDGKIQIDLQGIRGNGGFTYKPWRSLSVSISGTGNPSYDGQTTTITYDWTLGKWLSPSINYAGDVTSAGQVTPTSPNKSIYSDIYIFTQCQASGINLSSDVIPVSLNINDGSDDNPNRDIFRVTHVSTLFSITPTGVKTFKAPNGGVGKIWTSDANGLGSWAPNPLGTGSINVPAGYYYQYDGAPFAWLHGNNSFVGAAGNASFVSLTGVRNTGHGAGALVNILGGFDNTAVGYNALGATTSGGYNVAVGSSALRYNVSGSWNVAVGLDALHLLNGGNGSNIAIGMNAQRSCVAGAQNTVVGNSALVDNTYGSYNTAVGFQAGQNLIGGIGGGEANYNTMIGYLTGLGVVTGNNNTVLGANVAGLSSTLSDNIILAIGTGAIKSQFDGSNWAFTGGVKSSSYLGCGVGGNVASDTTITPTGGIFHVTGTNAIQTINVPYTGWTGSITLIPDAIFTTTTGGNIALGSTAVVNKALIMTYDGTSWYPSY